MQPTENSNQLSRILSISFVACPVFSVRGDFRMDLALPCDGHGLVPGFAFDQDAQGGGCSQQRTAINSVGFSLFVACPVFPRFPTVFPLRVPIPPSRVPPIPVSCLSRVPCPCSLPVPCSSSVFLACPVFLPCLLPVPCSLPSATEVSPVGFFFLFVACPMFARSV